MTNEELQQIFFVECEESLAAAEAGLAACQAGTHDAETVNAIFRAVHSIKGGAGAFGFAALQAYTHTFETLLSDVREGMVDLTPGLVDLLLRALDVLSDHVAAVREGAPDVDDAAVVAELAAAQGGGGTKPAKEAVAVAVDECGPAASADDAELDFDLDSLLDDLVGLDETATAEAGEAAEGWLLHVRPHAGAMLNGGEPLLLLREVASLGGECILCDTANVPPLDLLVPGQGYLGWTFRMPAHVDEAEARDIFDFVGDDCSIAMGNDAAIPAPRIESALPAVSVKQAAESRSQPADSAPAAAAADTAAAASPAAVAGQTIRIDLAKLDRLIDSVGELVIAQAMVAQRMANQGVSASEELTLLDSLTRDIQESAMSIRAQPIGTVFSRVPRILRELAASTGKHVRLSLSGEATELDKTVIERLGEPLTHLIRNAVDHGIESAEERLAAGKEADGTLTLSAEHRSGRILIRIADDGRGIDRERVLAKAVAQGLVSADAQLSPEEIDNLIFAPGFSTAASVTSVSGRGVGMDVVRQNVKDLGGRVTIESHFGKGTTFTLTLPLTLAIADGMVVGVGDETMVVPLAHIVECLRPEPGDLQAMGGRHMINLRGRYIPVLPVGETIGIGGSAPDGERGVMVVVDTEAAGKAALLVDHIHDQRQFVIKSLDTHFHQVEGVAGATILGDGQVALILDVDGLAAGAMNILSERQAA
ncbi:chemotaxis protein CheA [Novosphingobium sp.]|uniref:chemotaxis protein CheA n=1 Tax=Novosphingobium sp. TaxID=1874826 RepID=UPI00352AD0A9